ncbi:hypothetical protein D3C71_1709780 [compost metagenome]
MIAMAIDAPVTPKMINAHTSSGIGASTSRGVITPSRQSTPQTAPSAPSRQRATASVRQRQPLRRSGVCSTRARLTTAGTISR